MRAALRNLRRRPAFSATAILTIALGIGANTALFSVIYSVLIRPLPFRDPGRLVQIWETHPALPRLQVAMPDFEDWRSQARSFEQLAVYTLSAMNNITLLGQGAPAVIHGTMASSNLFPAMGIQPLAGRAFTAEEERTKQHVVLISEALWRRRFGSDPRVIGRQIRLETESFRMIGIVPQRQAFPEWADLWMPLSLVESDLRTTRKYHPLEVIARLKPGVTTAEAEVGIETIARRLAAQHPATNGHVGAYLVPLAEEITAGVRPSLMLAWAAGGLVLLIACVNLAHLFLARMLERRDEIAIREALGATPWRLMRQLLGESLLVAAIGGAAGLALAAWAVELLRKIAPSHVPRIEWTTLNGPVWLFAIAISAIAGVLFGLPAGWQAMRPRKPLSGAGMRTTRAQSRLSAVLMAAEIAMSLTVLSGAALLTRNFAALLDEDPGFQAANVWEIPNLPLRPDWNAAAQFLSTRVEPALRALPGVIDVAAVNSAPMSLRPTEHSRFSTRFGIGGRTFHSGNYPVAQTRWITSGFFHVLGIPLERGRWLDETDRDKPRIVINESMARRFFPDRDPVGQRLILGVMDPKQNASEIVGVVGDVRDFGLDHEPEPTFYGVSTGPAMTLLVKTASGSGRFAAALRDAIHSVDPEIPVTTVEPLEQNVADSLADRRFALLLLAIFGAMAALLTAGGIYGLLAQSVTARIREFGVRAAIGAAPAELIAMILREALTLAIPGLIAGAVLSLAFAKTMKTVVSQLSAADPISIAVACALLLAIVFCAAWLPARRAAAVDPAAALRSE
jgi:putative ABC transport system permease protein